MSQAPAQVEGITSALWVPCVIVLLIVFGIIVTFAIAVHGSLPKDRERVVRAYGTSFAWWAQIGPRQPKRPRRPHADEEPEDEPEGTDEE